MSRYVKGYSVKEPEPTGPKWEAQENPQAYDQNVFFFVHKKAAANMLGVVGGNDVSLIKGNMVDLESDLRGLNLPNTFCPERKYQAPSQKEQKIVRDNVKTRQVIDVTPQHLPQIQMWAYPVVAGPEPLTVEQCGRPERF